MSDTESTSEDGAFESTLFEQLQEAAHWEFPHVAFHDENTFMMSVGEMAKTRKQDRFIKLLKGLTNPLLLELIRMAKTYHEDRREYGKQILFRLSLVIEERGWISEVFYLESEKAEVTEDSDYNLRSFPLSDGDTFRFFFSDSWEFGGTLAEHPAILKKVGDTIYQLATDPLAIRLLWTDDAIKMCMAAVSSISNPLNDLPEEQRRMGTEIWDRIHAFRDQLEERCEVTEGRERARLQRHIGDIRRLNSV